MTYLLVRGSVRIGEIRPQDDRPRTLRQGSGELFPDGETSTFVAVTQVRTPTGIAQSTTPVLDLVALANEAQQGRAPSRRGPQALEEVAMTQVEPTAVLAIRDAEGSELVPDFLQVVKFRMPAGVRDGALLARETWQLQWMSGAT